MTPQERQLLESLATRIASTPVPEKDRDAEDLIRQRIGSNPNALYILTQTTLIQDMALQHANSQIQELQQRLARQSEGGSSQEDHPRQSFLGRLFGAGGYAGGYAGSSYAAPAPQTMSSGVPSGIAPGIGSSFLRSAATTAAGVAAGALAFEGIEALLGRHGGMGVGQGFMSGGGAGMMDSSPLDTGYDVSPGDDNASVTDADSDDLGDSSNDDSSNEDSSNDDSSV
ncbi:MAG: DUF2076 domain-containing protein [Acidobacteriota bacterium]|nr:DUF2076 domain-containing protein [Acidobacteriota bacterium]